MKFKTSHNFSHDLNKNSHVNWVQSTCSYHYTDNRHDDKIWNYVMAHLDKIGFISCIQKCDKLYFFILQFKYMIFHIFPCIHCIFTGKLTTWLAPSWLNSSVGKGTAPVSQKSWVPILFKPKFVFQALILQLPQLHAKLSWSLNYHYIFQVCYL